MRAVPFHGVHLNAEGTGYVICLPVPGIVTQVQTNMAATLNVDWVLSLAADALRDFGHEVTHRDLVARVDQWLAASRPGLTGYLPYISEAGERGPFVNADARAGFFGLSMTTRYADLVRAVTEGLGMAMRDCYAAMGSLPQELRLTGGAARSKGLRAILGSAINAKVRTSAREEAGAAGAAMMAAVAIGAYPDMNACIAEWVTPLLSAPEDPDPQLVATYDRLFPAFLAARSTCPPVWEALAHARAAATTSGDK
jgi:erythritol kinase